MKDQIMYVKIRNGCWRVYRNGKVFSEHSMERGAKEAFYELTKDNV